MRSSSATWNQNDTDPTSADVGDGPESGEDHSGNNDHAPTGPDTTDATDSGDFSGELSDADGDGLIGADDATPNQNDTDPTSTDIGDGPEGNAGYSGSTDTESTDSDTGYGDSDSYGSDPGSCTCF